MKKSALNTSINTTNWSDSTSPLRVPSNDRAVGNQIKDLLFGTPVFQNNGGGDTIIDGLNTGLYSFEILVTPMGGSVMLSGFIRNITGFPIITPTDPNTLNVLKIIDTDYEPIDTNSPSTGDPFLYYFTGRTEQGTECQFCLGWIDISGTPTPVIRVIPTMLANTTSSSKYQFSIIYQTKQ